MTAPLVVFASWRCNCTLLAAAYENVPQRCPEHDQPLLGRPSWEDNPHDVPLGFQTEAVRS